MKWERSDFRIECDSNGQIKWESVSGLISQRFGIHWDCSAYSLTHLLTGRRIMAFNSEFGAQQIAKYLDVRYGMDFDAIVNLNKEDELYQQLKSKITTDPIFENECRKNGIGLSKKESAYLKSLRMRTNSLPQKSNSEGKTGKTESEKVSVKC